MLTSDVYRIGNILAHYELYKKIVNLPGDIIECGVFKGSSLIQFASFRELLENEKSRKIVGFDAFGRFPNSDVFASDECFVDSWNEVFADDFLSKEDLLDSLRHKNINNIELVKGNILTTVQEYLSENSHTRVALLHIDTDVYEPAQKALDLLFDRVVLGGVVCFDDYGVLEGETIAVDEFMKEHQFPLNKFSFSHTKPSFFIKDRI